MDNAKTAEFVSSAWAADKNIVKSLEQYIAIPNISPSYDPEWATNGLLDQAAVCLADSVKKLLAEFNAQGIPANDVAVRIVGGSDAPILNEQQNRRTPVILVDIPAFGATPPDGSVLLYGHLDKQPGLAEQWSAGLGPHTPVIRDGKLYGRGGADDGYSIFSALTAVMAVRQQNAPHARSVILMESCEESGSTDLEYYVGALKEELGDVTLIVCLDSGCQNYEQLWITASLRGLVNGSLHIAASREGVHSGDASGVIPSPFRILRILLSRLEDQDSGELFPPELKVDIPAAVREAAARTAAALGDRIAGQFPFLEGVRPVHDDPLSLVLARTWQSQVVVKGMDGFPPRAGSGNVLLPELTASLSFRLPPTLSSRAAGEFIKKTLERDPPYNARVEFSIDDIGDGWAAPETPAWLDQAMQDGSRAFYGREAMTMGEGGSIPFMGLLGRVFPRARFLIAGVLGPQANAHGPDEFLHLEMAEKVTMCVAKIICEHGAANGE